MSDQNGQLGPFAPGTTMFEGDDDTPTLPTDETIPQWGRALIRGQNALHGEFQLLRADVNAKLSQRQLVLAVVKYGGTAALTALTTLAPKWAPILGELLKALQVTQ